MICWLKTPCFIFWVTLLSALLPITAQGEVTLTYHLDLDSRTSTQVIHINDQRAWIKGFGGHNRWDLIFDATSTTWALIDHQQKETLTFRQKDLRKIEGQMNAIGPLLEGLKESLKTLPGDQGGLLKKSRPEDKGFSNPKASTWTLKAKGTTERLARLTCQTFEIRHGSREGLTFCPAPLSSLDLPAAERAILQRLLEEATGILMAAQGLLATKGLPSLTEKAIPSLSEKDLERLAGLPLSMRSLTDSKPGSFRLESIEIQGHPGEEPRWPENYRQRKLKLW